MKFQKRGCEEDGDASIASSAKTVYYRIPELAGISQRSCSNPIRATRFGMTGLGQTEELSLRSSGLPP